jgi:hypothetical protein
VFTNLGSRVEFDRPDPGDPIDANALLFSFPTFDDTLNAGLIRTGVDFLGIESEFDYITRDLIVPAGAETAYQSELLNDEVSPELTAAVSDATTIQSIVQARLYSLQGYGLRRSSEMTPEVAAAIIAANHAKALPQNGPGTGGTPITIDSPLGNLAYIDRVEFFNQDGDLVTTSTLNRPNDTPRGTDEFQVIFDSPRSTEAGVMDLTIFLRSAPEDPAVTLDNFFTYTSAPTPPCPPIWLILLALLLALLGLASGGESGGGSGGPCFIATAAYGTPMNADIDTLRDVRDEYLLSNVLGSSLVDGYYQASPTVANMVASHPALAALVRVLLVPVIFLGKVALTMPALAAFLGVSIGFAMILRSRRKARA